ncbi:MAG: hypothetical protein ABEJ65_04750, partial [bacterium]
KLRGPHEIEIIHPEFQEKTVTIEASKWTGEPVVRVDGDRIGRYGRKLTNDEGEVVDISTFLQFEQPVVFVGNQRLQLETEFDKSAFSKVLLFLTAIMILVAVLLAGIILLLM